MDLTRREVRSWGRSAPTGTSPTISSGRIPIHCSLLFAVRSPSEEDTPLLPGKPGRTISAGTCKLMTFALLAVLFVLVDLYLHFTNCPLYPSTMVAIRREWDKETMRHELFREEWQLEEQEHAVILEEWKLQK